MFANERVRRAWLFLEELQPIKRSRNFAQKIRQAKKLAVTRPEQCYSSRAETRITTGFFSAKNGTYII